MSRVMNLILLGILLSTVGWVKRPTGNLQLINIVGRAVGYEALAVTRFKHSLSGEPRFYLDPYHNRAVVIAEHGVEQFPYRFSMLTPDEQRPLDLRELDHRGTIGDFLTLDRLPGFLFTPDHYVFWGKHNFYLVDRQQLSLELVTTLNQQASSHYRVIQSQLLGDLVTVLYRDASNREYLQFISLDSLSIDKQYDLDGTLLAVTEEFIISQKGPSLVIFNHRHGQRQLYTVFDPIAVQLAANNLLIVASSDKTLSLVDLQNKQFRHLALDDETSLIATRTGQVPMQLTDDALYLIYDRQLSKVQLESPSQVVWQRPLPEQPRHLHVIDNEHLLVVFANRLTVIDQRGNTVLHLATVSDQHLEDVTFADRYLRLIVENDFHRAGQFNFSLVQIPVSRLLELHRQFPLLQKISSFTLASTDMTFSDFILTAVDSFLSDNPDWQDRQQLIQLIRKLATTPSATLPELDSYLKKHG